MYIYNRWNKIECCIFCYIVLLNISDIIGMLIVFSIIPSSLVYPQFSFH